MTFRAPLSGSNHRTISFVGVVLFVGLIATAFLVRRGAGDLESQTWDRRLRWLAETSKPDPRIKIIIIDQASLDTRAKLENQFWPWPRTLYNPVLYFLQKSGAKGVAFDLLFTEPSATSVKDDEKFAKAVGSTIPVITAMALRASEPDPNFSIPPEIEEKQRKQFDNSPFFQALVQKSKAVYTNAAFPIPPVAVASTALANVSVPTQSRNDKIFRYASPGGTLNGVPVLDLPFALFDVTHPLSNIASEILPHAERDGRYIVRYHGPAGTYPWYSIDAVIQSWSQLQSGEQPQIPLDTFKDSYVFVGASAGGLFDLRPTPLSGDVPGVEFNATVFDNILNNNFMRRVPTPVAVAAMFLFIGIAAAPVFSAKLRVQIALALLALCLVLGTTLTAAVYGWWMPLVVPLVSVVLSTSLSYVLQYYFEGRQRQFLRSAFGHYVSPEVIDQIVVDPNALALGGERREVSIFFSDLIGFSSISERLDPPLIAAFLNKFLSDMTDIILEEGGTVDKYEGDAIIAFWNAPIEMFGHEMHAVRAALRCNARLEELAPGFKEEYGISTRACIGIHTGDVVVGNFGSRTRFNYTIIGDSVNLTSRIEGVNRVFGTSILVSEGCHLRCKDNFGWRRIGRVGVVGRVEPVDLFEPFLLPISGKTADSNARFARAIEHFEAGQLADAQKVFEGLGGDPVSQAYLQRIKRTLEIGFDSSTWSPVWLLERK